MCECLKADLSVSNNLTENIIDLSGGSLTLGLKKIKGVGSLKKIKGVEKRPSDEIVFEFSNQIVVTNNSPHDIAFLDIQDTGLLALFTFDNPNVTLTITLSVVSPDNLVRLVSNVKVTNGHLLIIEDSFLPKCSSVTIIITAKIVVSTHFTSIGLFSLLRSFVTVRGCVQIDEKIGEKCKIKNVPFVPVSSLGEKYDIVNTNIH